MICLDVKNLPTLPAKGESFTEKFMEIVGSEIFTNSRPSVSSVDVIVSPMLMSSMPVTATIEPDLDESTSTLLRPSNS